VPVKSNPIAIVVLTESSLAIGRQIQAVVPNSQIYGLAGRVSNPDICYEQFGATVKQLFSEGNGIIGICAAGILIRTVAPLLSDKRLEAPVIAIASDGSAVVPLLGGLNGANELADRIGKALGMKAAITTAGQVQFQANLLSPPKGYILVNSDQEAKIFVSDLLAGAKVSIIGESESEWLSGIEFSDRGTHTIEILEYVPDNSYLPKPNRLVYYREPLINTGSLAIAGIGPGASKWMSGEVREILQEATDWVGYKTYLDLAVNLMPFSSGKVLHGSDNRVESDRAKLGLNLASQGKKVVIISSGDPGIYAMAAAMFEVLATKENPAWEEIHLQVAPGISAMQAAAAQVGAPLGHDFCVISLSDILKPWQIITTRLKAALEADLVIAIYNPISSQRPWQLNAAVEIINSGRSLETPVILATSLGREKHKVRIIDLAQLSPDAIENQINMQTVILIGSSQTRKIQRANGEVWVYTPRTYPQEYQRAT
jgi:cobalt-precorrin 5A hydrolase / precorrin-3B C17-methyltransferase